MWNNNLIEAIDTSGIVAVLRGTEEEVVSSTRAAIRGGICIIEITTTVPNAFEVMIRLKKEFKSQHIYIGMGTVLNQEDALGAINAGADFIVTPHLDVAIIETCQNYRIPIMPGVFTLTEMITALSTGCKVLKLFPADIAGPSYIKSAKGPLPDVKIMPTGGVNGSTIKDQFRAGASAVGIGSNLTKAGGANLDESKISEYVTSLVKQVQEVKVELG